MLRRILICFLGFAGIVAMTHELPDDRVTIVQREPTHLSITFYVDEVGLLQRIMAPKSSRAEFLLACAAMPQDALERRLVTARESFTAQLALRSGAGKSLMLTKGHWPALSDTRKRLTDSAMATIATGSDHEHSAPIEIGFDAIGDAPIETVTFVTPVSLPELVVVSYKPLQRRVSPDTGRIDIHF